MYPEEDIKGRPLYCNFSTPFFSFHHFSQDRLLNIIISLFGVITNVVPYFCLITCTYYFITFKLSFDTSFL